MLRGKRQVTEDDHGSETRRVERHRVGRVRVCLRRARAGCREQRGVFYACANDAGAHDSRAKYCGCRAASSCSSHYHADDGCCGRRLHPPSGFNAGSGVIEPDGKMVVFRIADGTGGNNWNKKQNPIRVRRGMVLRLIDEDKSTRSGGHWLHTNGQPCPHGLKAIGAGSTAKSA